MDTGPSLRLNYRLGTWFCVAALLYQLTIIYLFQGTADDGDSITHYLYARWSFKYHQIWIDHFGKPIFTFFASPFAQFGFKGIQVFNSIMSIGAAYLTHLVADKLLIRNSAFVVLIFLLMPEVMKASISGWTELLFSFLLMGSIYLFLTKKYLLAYLIISFLPFSRPDGNAIIFFLFFYSLFDSNLRKYIPILSVGHILLTLCGVLFFDENWSWVFSDNPNAFLNYENKLNGCWDTYLNSLLPIMGLPAFILMFFGIVFVLLRIWKNKNYFSSEYMIYAIGVGLFLMHTIIFKLGILRGIGLHRYLIPILPIISIIILRGIMCIQALLFRIKLSLNISFAMCIISIGIYNFSYAKYGARFPNHYCLNDVQKLSRVVFSFVKKKYPSAQPIYTSYPYLTMLWDKDPYDLRYHRDLSLDNLLCHIPESSIIIWDSWYAPREGKVGLDMLFNNPKLRFIRRWDMGMNNSPNFVVFEKI